MTKEEAIYQAVNELQFMPGYPVPAVLYEEAYRIMSGLWDRSREQAKIDLGIILRDIIKPECFTVAPNKEI